MNTPAIQANLALEPDGLEAIPRLLPPDDLAVLRTECDRLLQESANAGVRSVFSRSSLIAAWATSREIRRLIESHLDAGAFVSRSIIFDKHATANWDVTWHQDTTIAVRERIDKPGFGPWSIKDGVTHVRPPASILDSMLTLRLHLDDTPGDNGALLVIPGSHQFGILSHDRISEFTKTATPVVCELKAGDAMLMRPLLLHASRKANRPSRRRVIHLEFAFGELPTGLSWATC